MEKAVVIEYRTSKSYCKCCDQKLEKPIISGVWNFTLTKENFLEWSNDWNDVSKYDEDLQEVIEEFVYDTIDFFATSSYESVLIEKSEFDKAKQFLLSEVVSDNVL